MDLTVTVASKLTPRRRRPDDDELEESKSSEDDDDMSDERDRWDGMGLVGIVAGLEDEGVISDRLEVEAVDTIDIRSSSTWP